MLIINFIIVFDVARGSEDTIWQPCQDSACAVRERRVWSLARGFEAKMELMRAIKLLKLNAVSTGMIYLFLFILFLYIYLKRQQQRPL